MVQSVAIDPGDRIDINSEDIVHGADELDKPFFVVKRTVRDSQMQNIGQVQPGYKPAKDKIRGADEQTYPRPPLSWRRIHTSHQVEKNDQIADCVVTFHEALAWDSSSPKFPMIQAEIKFRFK